MARILYGLCAVGMGHAVRSKVVLDHLIKKNEVIIATSGKSHEYLKRFYPEKLIDIEGFELAFKNNAIENAGTLRINFKKVSSKTIEKFRHCENKLEEFKPDIVVSDWEPFSSVYAKKHKIPLISIDNQHYLVFGDYKFPKKYWFQYFKARIVLQALMRKSDYYIITTLPENKLKKIKNIFEVPPIVRGEVLKLKPEKRDYILVYQSTKSYEKLVDILKHVNKKFIVYGFDKDKVEENLRFKKFTPGGEFIRDLANAKAIIVNGGFTLISEALFLGKPILSVPIKGHFEQIINALYIREHYCGEFYENLDRNNIIHFLMNLDKYNVPKFKVNNNKKLLNLLDKIIEKEMKK